jgi:hypothetical protein
MRQARIDAIARLRLSKRERFLNAAQVSDSYGVWLSATASMKRLWGMTPPDQAP